jgi:3-hydroxybutyryl-CoA dehydrogenase
VDRAGVRAAAPDQGEAIESPDGLVELPSGALLTLSSGAAATLLAARLSRPVIVADRVLDPATATAIAIAASDGCPEAALTEAAGLLQAAGLDVYVIADTPGLIVTRTVAMLANLAFDAQANRVASEQDIDTAMRLGVNYPLGPLAWGRQWGTGTLVQILDRLDDWYRDSHYRASPLLRHAAAAEALSAPRRYAVKMPAGSGLSERIKEGS